MSKFYIETPFDRWLIFELNKNKIKAISFSNKKEGKKLSGTLEKMCLEIFDKKSFEGFDYSSLSLDHISKKAKKVHDFLISTEFGQTFCYSQVAQLLFRDKKYARAVAMILHTNRFAFFVPCHRVIAKNGIGGYSAGIDLKLKILNWENKSQKIAIFY